METKTHMPTPPTGAAAGAGARRAPSHPMYMKEGLGPKKTAFIIVTVIGCIAILWPKVFYPMMFGSSPPKQNIKEPRPGGCCDVVFDSGPYLNSTPAEIGPQLYHKQLNLYTGEMSLRQERPTHLHPESIYMAMRERGRAIPSTIPVVERKGSPSNPPPRIVEGRPGPIPGMRPPMGAGSLHQPQAKGNSMGFIMPLYTIGIIVFFGYTIMKIVFKKPVPNAPYGPAPTDPNFRKDVFGHENDRQRDNSNNPKLVVTAIQGLIDAADEELKLRENKATSELSKNSNDSSSKNVESSNEYTTERDENVTPNTTNNNNTTGSNTSTSRKDVDSYHKRREGSADRSVAVMGMEVTASCEGGQKWSGRPPTPVFGSHNDNVNVNDANLSQPQSIYLEGSLAHESQILVADSETKTEEVYDAELNGSQEEPAVVLSSKMTLSLINLDSNGENNVNVNNDIESPLADDIEIIGHDEKTLN